MNYMKTKGNQQIWNYLQEIAICFLILFLHSCEKEKLPGKLPVQQVEVDSILDIDSNVYKIVKIGNQWWMAENLKVVKYRNGDNISNFTDTDPKKWAELETGAFCSVSGTFTTPVYNWYAVNDPRGIAPAGWHVSSDEDWKEMERFLGMSESEIENVSWRGTNEGGKLKATQSTYGESTWVITDSIQNTNEYGFCALPGGCRMFNGDLGVPGGFYTGFWWTLTEYGGDMAWYRYLDYQYPGIFRFYGQKNYGFSVRCVKD
jgi:uncharacterized protein (TIGR02145 family)